MEKINNDIFNKIEEEIRKEAFEKIMVLRKVKQLLNKELKQSLKQDKPEVKKSG